MTDFADALAVDRSSISRACRDAPAWRKLTCGRNSSARVDSISERVATSGETASAGRLVPRTASMARCAFEDAARRLRARSGGGRVAVEGGGGRSAGAAQPAAAATASNARSVPAVRSLDMTASYAPPPTSARSGGPDDRRFARTMGPCGERPLSGWL
jgi:hypothetical protein